MKIWHFIALGVFFLVTYYVIPVLFWLAVLIIIVYVLYRLYRLVERMMTPKGMRIRHGALRGHLEHEYGTREGRKLYREMVGELRKKGYR